MIDCVQLPADQSHRAVSYSACGLLSSSCHTQRNRSGVLNGEAFKVFRCPHAVTVGWHYYAGA